jgi:hypothetical protein
MLAHSNLPLLTTAALSSPLAVAAPQALLGSHPWRTLRRVTATPNSFGRASSISISRHTVRLFA